jgi:hypothetical protein
MTGDSATQNMEIFANTAELPDAESQSFDATNPLVITLADGTEINIPAGAIATSGTVKVVITPMVEELQNTLTARPFGFGYAMYAFDGDDNQITGTFNRNVTLSFYYTDDELQRRGVNEDDLSPAYFSTTTNSWTKVESYSVDREANRLTVQINHFSTWALTAPAEASEPEPTPPENLLAKASFEERGRIPRPWRGKNLTLKDKRVCDTAHDGSCSFRMLGTTAKKFLRQVVTASGKAGDSFTLSAWSKAKKPLRKGGPYCLAAKVFHRDGTKKTYRVCFAKKTHGWQRRSKTFTTVKRYNKIVVFLRYVKQGGTAWFDDVSLIEN